MIRYELQELRRWVHRDTGASASVYGAVPWTNDFDKPNWRVERVGWGYRDERNGTIHGKHGTCLAEAIDQVNRMNARRAAQAAKVIA